MKMIWQYLRQFLLVVGLLFVGKVLGFGICGVALEKVQVGVMTLVEFVI